MLVAEEIASQELAVVFFQEMLGVDHILEALLVFVVVQMMFASMPENMRTVLF